MPQGGAAGDAPPEGVGRPLDPYFDPCYVKSSKSFTKLQMKNIGTGGEINESTPGVEESLANIGAAVMGRNMFGGHPGPWDPETPWNGW